MRLKSPRFRGCEARAGERRRYFNRGLFGASQIASLKNRIAAHFSRPAIAGARGYYKTDYPKRIAMSCDVGGPVVPMLLDPTIIGLIEDYMVSDCILASTAIKQEQGVGYVYFYAPIFMRAGGKVTKRENA